MESHCFNEIELKNNTYSILHNPWHYSDPLWRSYVCPESPNILSALLNEVPPCICLIPRRPGGQFYLLSLCYWQIFRRCSAYFPMTISSVTFTSMTYINGDLKFYHFCQCQDSEQVYLLSHATVSLTTIILFNTYL